MLSQLNKQIKIKNIVRNRVHRGLILKKFYYMRTLPLLFCFLFTLNVLAQIPVKAEDISPLLIGETIPNVALKNAEGETVVLQNVIKKKPTVLMVYRGGWCPYCNRHLSALGELESEIIALGYQVVAISPDHYEMLKPTYESEDVKYILLSDAKAEFIKAMGIGFKTPERAKGYIFKKTEKEASEVLPVPTVMILDTKGQILYEYINPDYSVRLSNEVLLANLKALKS